MLGLSRAFHWWAQQREAFEASLDEPTVTMGKHTVRLVLSISLPEQIFLELAGYFGLVSVLFITGIRNYAGVNYQHK